MKNEKDTSSPGSYKATCLANALEFSTCAELFKKANITNLQEDCLDNALMLEAMAARGLYGNLMIIDTSKFVLVKKPQSDYETLCLKQASEFQAHAEVFKTASIPELEEDCLEKVEIMEAMAKRGMKGNLTILDAGRA